MREALLLVGGQGTRLRPLTWTTPKPMLPVAGVPFIAHQLAKLRDAGVEHVILATSYKPEIFAQYFADGAWFDLDIDYVEESEPLGTGGAIRNSSTALRGAADDPIVILNGDVFSGHDLAGQVKQHERTNADVTLHLVQVDDARTYGCVPTNDDGEVLAFLEKMPEPVTNWVNAGAYVFRRSVIDTIPVDAVVSVERETFPGLLATGSRIFAWRENAYWIDVGTPEALVRCSADVVAGRVTSSALPRTSGGVLVADGAVISPTARLRTGTSIASGVTVKEEAVVDESIVMGGASIGASAVVKASVVGHNAVIGAGCRLADSVIGDGATLQDGVELPSGSRVEPDDVIGFERSGLPK